jgi:Ca-activated chloride channel family protein
VSFQAPPVLLALLALPVLVAVYWRMQLRRRAEAAAFAAPALHPSVAPRRPGWRRHAPMLAVLIALAILVLAAARPQRTVAVPIEHASVMLATDVSASMISTDVRPSRLAAAKQAARRFVRDVPSKIGIGVLAFNGKPSVLQSPTRDRAAVEGAIDGMRPSGGTATGDAILAATRALRSVVGGGGRRPPSAIVLLSDGKSTTGTDPLAAARAARRLRIPVYTVALGTAHGTITVPRRGGGTQTVSVPPDPAALARIASESGGTSFTAATATGLKQVYAKLGSQLSHRNAKRQVTSAFAGGGLALLLLGAAMSLRWFGRLI